MTRTPWRSVLPGLFFSSRGIHLLYHASEILRHESLEKEDEM